MFLCLEWRICLVLLVLRCEVNLPLPACAVVQWFIIIVQVQVVRFHGCIAWFGVFEDKFFDYLFNLYLLVYSEPFVCFGILDAEVIIDFCLATLIHNSF